MPVSRKGNTREELLREGVQELNKHGIVDFSVRRIAEACGVSPGAPYKHFNNRNAFIAAIIEYVNTTWFSKLQAIIDLYPGDYRRQITEILMAYVRFLVENPHFRSLLMVKDDSFDQMYHGLRSKLSSMTRAIEDKYCRQVGMCDEIRVRKEFILRSYMYGAALMFGNGELPYNEQMLETVRAAVDREFDLP